LIQNADKPKSEARHPREPVLTDVTSKCEIQSNLFARSSRDESEERSILLYVRTGAEERRCGCSLERKRNTKKIGLSARRDESEERSILLYVSTGAEEQRRVTPFTG
jgi:hypothetical protein